MFKKKKKEEKEQREIEGKLQARKDTKCQWGLGKTHQLYGAFLLDESY